MTNLIRARRALAIGAAAVALGLTAAVAGQSAQPPAAAPPRTQMDELLAEVRALRADLDRASAASMRGQLVGMRLQLQEQRIAAIARQLSDVQQRIRENTQARMALAGPLKMFEGMQPAGGSEKAQEMDVVFGPLKEQLAALDVSDAELKAEEAALQAQLRDEQSRWTAFNSQIEELERAATGKTRR